MLSKYELKERKIRTMKKTILLFILILPLIYLKAEEKKKKPKLSINGFVSAEMNYDTRQTVNSREGDVLLYPKPELLDSKGNDINASGALFMSTIHSRLSLSLTDFSVFQAQGKAVIEGDFVGTSTDYTGLFRLRHAYLKLNWEKSSLLMGKYWHPMFVTSCYPHISHWGGGLPFHVLSRAPQLRFNYFPMKSLRLQAALLSEMDFKSTGPNGSSEQYVQNAQIPELSFQAAYDVTKQVQLGMTVGLKTLKPSLVNAQGVVTDATLSSIQSNAWMRYQNESFALSLQGIYGQNMNNFVMLGGYGISDIDAKGEVTYTNINTGSLWADFYTKKGALRLGCYAGYTQNMGSSSDIFAANQDHVYSRGKNIASIYQLAPRIEYYVDHCIFGLEVIQTGAAYGTWQKDCTVKDAEYIHSTRLQLHVRYRF